MTSFTHYYYCMCYATIATFVISWKAFVVFRLLNLPPSLAMQQTNYIMLTLIDAIVFFFGSILIYCGGILVLVWIARVFVCFIVVGLLGLIATENKDVTKNKDAVYNEIEPLTSSLPTGVVRTTTPPPLVPEPTGLHTVIEQWCDI